MGFHGIGGHVHDAIAWVPFLQIRRRGLRDLKLTLFQVTTCMPILPPGCPDEEGIRATCWKVRLVVLQTLSTITFTLSFAVAVRLSSSEGLQLG